MYSLYAIKNGVSGLSSEVRLLSHKPLALVKVDELRPVEFRKKAFKRLVVRDDYKTLIKAMVRASNLEKPGFSDLVSGKGRGLTILLHGPPGTGKTLTAGT